MKHGTQQYFFKEPLFRHLTMGYRHDLERQVHTIQLDPETVLDRKTMERLQTQFKVKDQYKTFYTEWALYCDTLFKAEFPDVM